MSSTFNPADIRGFARKNGGLLDHEFITNCPPDIQPNTRIIAVCGVTDTVGMAAPGRDGWFHSDMWAFHGLLRDSSMCPFLLLWSFNIPVYPIYYSNLLFY